MSTLHLQGSQTLHGYCSSKEAWAWQLDQGRTCSSKLSIDERGTGKFCLVAPFCTCSSPVAQEQSCASNLTCAGSCKASCQSCPWEKPHVLCSPLWCHCAITMPDSTQLMKHAGGAQAAFSLPCLCTMHKTKQCVLGLGGNSVI